MAVIVVVFGYVVKPKGGRHFFTINLQNVNVLSWASSTKDTYKQTICNNQYCQGIVWLCFYHKSVNLVIQADLRDFLKIQTVLYDFQRFRDLVRARTKS